MNLIFDYIKMLQIELIRFEIKFLNLNIIKSKKLGGKWGVANVEKSYKKNTQKITGTLQ